MTTIADLVEVTSVRVRDASQAVFDASVYEEAVRYGARSLFPSIWGQDYIDLGSVARAQSSVSLPESLDERYGANGYVVNGVEYQRAGMWYALRADVCGDLVTFPPLFITRNLRVNVLRPVVLPATSSEAITTLTPALLDVVCDFAVAWMLDGYLAGRQYFDKYSVSTQGDAVTPYDVETAARHFRQNAEARLEALRMPRPSVRWR